MWDNFVDLVWYCRPRGPSIPITPSNSEIICVQNVGAKVEMVSCLKKQINIKILKLKKNPGSPLEVTC